jgi:hypothetical protein
LRAKPSASTYTTPQEIDDIMALAIRVNDFLSGLFLGVGIRLVDFKMECGRLIALEPRQADLLSRICDNLLLSADELGSAGALTNVDEKPAATKRKSKSKSKA